jgi:hypothetical protein
MINASSSSTVLVVLLGHHIFLKSVKPNKIRSNSKVLDTQCSTALLKRCEYSTDQTIRKRMGYSESESYDKTWNYKQLFEQIKYMSRFCDLWIRWIWCVGDVSCCFSIIIISIKSWITVFIICRIPFSKKYRYQSFRKSSISLEFYLFNISINRVTDRWFPLIRWTSVEQHLHFSRHAQRRTL